jgi:hypothetical protein
VQKADYLRPYVNNFKVNCIRILKDTTTKFYGNFSAL